VRKCARSSFEGGAGARGGRRCVCVCVCVSRARVRTRLLGSPMPPRALVCVCVCVCMCGLSAGACVGSHGMTGRGFVWHASTRRRCVLFAPQSRLHGTCLVCCVRSLSVEWFGMEQNDWFRRRPLGHREREEEGEGEGELLQVSLYCCVVVHRTRARDAHDDNAKCAAPKWYNCASGGECGESSCELRTPNWGAFFLGGAFCWRPRGNCGQQLNIKLYAWPRRETGAPFDIIHYHPFCPCLDLGKT
jgi:hypothetical protein